MYMNPIVLVSFLGSLVLVSFAFTYLYYLYTRDREVRRKEEQVYEQSSKAFEKESESIVSENKEELNKIGNAMLASYRELLSGLKADSVAKTTETLKRMQDHAESQVREFAAILQKQTREAQSEIDRKIESFIETSHVEIERYKKEQTEKLKKSIQGAAASILSEVLHASVSEEEQEQLVIEALERAKRDGIL